MAPDITNPDSLTLEVRSKERTDGNYYPYSKILLQTNKTRNEKNIEHFLSMSKLGRELISSGQISDYRLRLEIRKEVFIVSPVPGRNTIVKEGTEISKDCTLEQYHSELFNKLTQREKQLLCFIYRGYQQSHIAFIYGITLETFKSHRKNIYKKMKFHNRLDLYNWCENFLPDHLEDVRNLSVQ